MDCHTTLAIVLICISSSTDSLALLSSGVVLDFAAALMFSIFRNYRRPDITVLADWV